MPLLLPSLFPSTLRDRRTAVAGFSAAALAATAAWTTLKARRAERDNRPKGSFVHVDGVRLHYLERGTGAPVVLLHGNGVRLEDFIASGLFGRLAQQHRVIAFDRPGFGHSERPRDRLWTADAQAALLRKACALLAIEQPIVVGHSWGASVAVALALNKSIAARKLVLISGYYFPTLRIDAPVFATPAIPLVGDVMRYTVSAVFARLALNRMVKAMFAPQAVPAAFLPTLAREMLVRPSQIRAEAEDAAVMIPAAISLRKRYRELAMPVTIFAAEADKVVDPDTHARQLHVELADSELHVLPGLGHMLHYAAAEQIVSAIASSETGFKAAAASDPKEASLAAQRPLARRQQSGSVTPGHC
jgi:pimeloyl-ACP methyl ester carboxylesterase